MKHTQGTWKVSSYAVGLTANVQDQDGETIAEVNGKSLKENHANAKLIAAAPELLEALIETEKALREVRDHFLNFKENEEKNPHFITGFLRSGIGGNSIRGNAEKVIKKATS